MSCMTKLEELAFIALYRNVVDFLLPIPIHHKKNMERPCCDAASSATVDGQSARQAARHHLNSKTSAEKNREIRLKLLKHFSQEEESHQLRISSFLDVILDESFDELSLSLFDEDDPFDHQVVPTIARRCPRMSALNITFNQSTASDDLCPHFSSVLTSSLAHLRHLTCLNLSKLPPHCKSMAFLLGRCCHGLQKLRIDLSDETFSAMELLTIFYSADVSRLEDAALVASDPPSWTYHRCQVSKKALHPFSQTLEEIRINCMDDDNPSVVGFLLRHLPQLKELDISDFEYKDYSASIRILWDIWDPTVSPSTIRCLEPHPLIPTGTADASIFEEHPDLIVQSYFTGTLSLVDLFLEGELEFQTLKSICDLCTNIQKLILLEAAVRPEDRNAENFSQERITSAFRHLKNMRIFTCTDSDGPLSTSITLAVAPYLTSLELALDGDFVPKFDFLTDCVNLQVLKLSPEFHPPLKNYFSQPVDRQRFLPNLEEIQLDFCMNAELEELFLKKSNLKHIDVLCLHHLGQTDDDLFQLFLQWPKLVSFKYKMPRKFTVEMVLQLLPHLPHLRSLSLYKDIKHRCLADFHLLKKACRLRDIKLDLQLFLDTYLCIDGDLNDELISTSDESETEC